MSHPATGPISPAEMQALADAPYGKAAEVLRKHDPFFGRDTGERIPWKLKLSRDVRQTATITVMAASEEEAEAEAEREIYTVDWDTDGDDDFDILEAIPA